MAWSIVRLPLKFQVGAVAALFVAALVALGLTSISVIERERRRASAKGVLDQAGSALEVRGRDVLATAPRWPDYLGPDDWTRLDQQLASQASRALNPFGGVEGGYYVRDFQRFVGSAFPTVRPEPAAKKRARPERIGPPRNEADLLEIQVDAAIRLGRSLFVVEASRPSLVAIRTAPVLVRGQTVAATWTMTRLDDPLFLNRSMTGYTLSAGLALGGMALSLVLMAGLGRTVRRQAAERDRLQTELRRSERLAALGKLLAGVAHEVRNPLAGIRSTIQLWQRGIGPDAESFEGLVDEADRLEGIVARLLHFSRADAQDLMVGDLNQVVQETARLTQASAEPQGVEVQVELEPELPAVWMAPPALVQVFRNLTTNALQAMPQGGTLRLSTRTDPKRDTVEVSVSDTGPGLSPDVQAHLFEPFFTTKSGGTGLGLAIAREIALAHRGELRAEPRAGEPGPGAGPGAVFTLTLPVAATEGNGDLVNERSRVDPGGRR